MVRVSVSVALALSLSLSHCFSLIFSLTLSHSLSLPLLSLSFVSLSLSVPVHSPTLFARGVQRETDAEFVPVARRISELSEVVGDTMALMYRALQRYYRWSKGHDGEGTGWVRVAGGAGANSGSGSGSGGGSGSGSGGSGAGDAVDAVVDSSGRVNVAGDGGGGGSGDVVVPRVVRSSSPIVKDLLAMSLPQTAANMWHDAGEERCLCCALHCTALRGGGCVPVCVGVVPMPPSHSEASLPLCGVCVRVCGCVCGCVCVAV
jgi:hypothetical protein